MADSPQGWQYPRPPTYPQGPGPSRSVLQPARPMAMRRAVALMYAGAALAVAGGVVEVLTTHNVMFYAYSSTRRGRASVALRVSTRNARFQQGDAPI